MGGLGGMGLMRKSVILASAVLCAAWSASASAENPAGSGGERVAERVIPLTGGRNFRDLGGYRTADGHTVRWGKIFRSGSMSDLTPADMRYLDGLGIRAVYDLRSSDERSAEPNRWAGDGHVRYWTHDYPVSRGDLGQVFDGKLTPTGAASAMQQIYRVLPYEQAPTFRALFEELSSTAAPLAFNCTAGKDRAGLAAALVLTVLGVPCETVLQDYLLTNAATIAPPKFAAGHAEAFAKVDPQVLRAFGSADAAYLRAAFDEMTRRDGSPAGYVRNVLGITDAQVAQMKANLLE
jgi:protein-tyrosine phosphatase